MVSIRLKKHKNLKNLIIVYASLTTQKMKFPIEDFFSKCDQICRKLRIWSHSLKKSLMENLIVCIVAELDSEFLLQCRDSIAMPNFFNFRISSQSLKASLTYKQCQLKLSFYTLKFQCLLIDLRVLIGPYSKFC